jgi:hypothetical protein
MMGRAKEFFLLLHILTGGDLVSHPPFISRLWCGDSTEQTQICARPLSFFSSSFSLFFYSLWNRSVFKEHKTFFSYLIRIIIWPSKEIYQTWGVGANYYSSRTHTHKKGTKSPEQFQCDFIYIFKKWYCTRE